MFLPERSDIETDRLTIRLLQAADVPSLFPINGDDAVTRYLPYETWKSSADGEVWFQRVSSRVAAGEAGQFVITQRESGDIVGTCLLFRFDQASARAEIGYVLARKYWGAGYMLEAMRAFVDFAFERVRLRRLEAEIDPRNAASARLLARLGFVKEGLLRQRWDVKGEVTDSALYGLLHTDRRAACAKRGEPHRLRAGYS
jgi:ribosomal-protein-alanine N-acetyltransferase